MPVETQVVSIPLGQGLDTKTDPKQLAVGKMSSLTNARFQTTKEIKKRPGHTAFTQNIQGGGTISSGVGVGSYQNELVELDGSSLYSYSSATTNWDNKGTLVPTLVGKTSIVKNTYSQSTQDSSINGSFQCFTWNDSSGGIRYSIIDTVTGQSIVNNAAVVATFTTSKVLAVGVYFVIIYYDSVAHNLLYKTINTTTPTTISGATTIVTDINTSFPYWDATVINNKIYVAYNSATSSRVSVYSISSTLVLSSRFDANSANANNNIAVFGDASFNVWVVSGNSGSVLLWAFVADPTLSSFVLAQTNLNIDCPQNHRMTGVVVGTTATVFFEKGDGNVHSNVFSTTFTILGISTLVNTVCSFASIAGKAFVYNGSIYIWVNFTDPQNVQVSYFLLNASSKVIAKILSGTAASVTVVQTVDTILPETNLASAGVYQIAFLEVDQLTSVNGVISTQSGVVSSQLTFSSIAPNKTLAGSTLNLSGGQITSYDGGSVVEQGFDVYPSFTADQTTSAVINSGAVGPGTSTASFNRIQYTATYEWIDNQGQINQSAPGVPQTFTLPGGGSTLLLSGTATNASASVTSIASTTGVAIGMLVTTFGDSGNMLNAPISSFSSTSVTTNQTYTGTTGTYPVIVGRNSVFPFAATANTVLESALTNISDTTGLRIGQVIQETTTNLHFPVGTYITAIATNTSFTTNNPALRSDTTALFYTFDIYEIALHVNPLNITNKSNVVLSLWKTPVNQTVFYRVTTIASPVFNSQFSTSGIVIDDLTPDTTLIGNDQLYTNGGEVSNIAPPATFALTTYKNRAIAFPSEDKNSFWYTKEIIPGTPLEFAQEFVMNIDAKGGSLGAGSQMDDKFILFKAKNNVFYMVGTGPSPSGANNDFSTPVLISTDVGCNNQNSIVEFPGGLLFQASNNRGIYMLDRSLAISYIGADVEAYNNQLVTSALRIPGSTTIQMMLSSGTALIYDWFFNQWDVDLLPASGNDAVIYNSQHTYVQTNGLVLEESAAVFTDNSAFIPLSPTTGWLNFDQIQGFQRVKELLIVGDYKGPHNLVVSIYYDFNVAIGQTVTIPVLSDPGVYQFRIFLTQQKCESLKISITDSQASGFNEGFSLSALTLEVGIKKGLDKLPAASTYA